MFQNLVESVEMLRDQKSDRDEVLDALRDKVSLVFLPLSLRVLVLFESFSTNVGKCINELCTGGHLAAGGPADGGEVRGGASGIREDA